LTFAQESSQPAEESKDAEKVVGIANKRYRRSYWSYWIKKNM